MHRWSMARGSKLGVWLIACAVLGGVPSVEGAVERDPLTLRVVAANPSVEKTQTVPVRIDLPKEVKPADILDAGELTIEFDPDRSTYYVYKAEVPLAPKQVRVFEVNIRDVWVIAERELDTLRAHTNLLLSRLGESEYAEPAKQLGNSIVARLDEIVQTQNDETLSSKQHIGAYRQNLQMLAAIKEDLERMEKLLSFTGGIPVPDMLEESPLKSDAPSTTTTWLIIFLILIFMGLLAGQFFFTWHRRVKAAADFTGERLAAFPQEETHSVPETTPGGDAR